MMGELVVSWSQIHIRNRAQGHFPCWRVASIPAHEGVPVLAPDLLDGFRILVPNRSADLIAKPGRLRKGIGEEEKATPHQHEKIDDSFVRSTDGKGNSLLMENFNQPEDR